MDEARLQAYVNLIERLLTCADGEELNILQANQELLDQELIKIMIAVAQQYEEAQNEDVAQWLIDMARELVEMLNDSSTLSTSDEYYNFLMESLQRVQDNPDPKSMYSFLLQNRDKLDENFAQFLDDTVRQILTEVPPEEVNSIAIDIFYFSNLILEFTDGDIAANKEIAIIGYQIVLDIISFDEFPEAWATTQNNLAIAYSDRIRGNKAENLEIAIAAHTEALKVRTFDAFPQDWAMTQNNLAAAYSERIRGDKAENLEQAISAYKEALKVYTFADFPQDWAMTRNNLATAYSERIRGNKAENLEYAIIAYQEVLKVYTFADFPKNWAMTQNNLANAYPNRIRGEKAENLEMAIASLNLSLEVYTRDSFPYEWARSQNNLGSAYKNRIKGDIAENLETAIFCYQEALKIRTFDAFPLDWATTQNNLGNAYSNRIRGNKAENIENAITCHQNALQIYTREAFPADWVKTQYNLANILRERFKLLGKLEDIQQAINAYKQAREIIETTEDKTLYFNYSYQLGKALFEGGYYTEAIEHLESCQQSYQKQKNISSLAPILLELARLYHRTGRLEQARLYFKDSLRLFRRLGDQDNVASVTSALGNLEIQIGKIPQACSHLKEAQEYYQQNNNTERLDEINHLLKILQSA